jgi:two-component system, response regulator, stage 0 sporulation protein F
MEKPEILYVDDEEINLVIFRIPLQSRYTVLTALDGHKGLEILASHPGIKMAFSDMRMPMMNGIEFIKKAKENFPDMPFYILTGFEIIPEIQQALDNGLIRKYYRKPFKLEEIEAEIEAVIKG